MSQKWLKKFLIYTSISIVIALSINILEQNYSELPESFDKIIRDYMFKFRGEKPHSNSVVIVDIDEKSLSKLGQWPWGRDKVAEILQKLNNANVSAIGMDIVFAEKDRSSPHKIFQDFNKSIKGIPNYDEIFAKTISSTPTILGYQFEFKNTEYLKKIPPSIPGFIYEKNKPTKNKYILEAKSVILNIPEIQDVAYSSGFFNNFPDESGMVRTIPLVIRYKDTMYPSLVLELIRALIGVQKIIINYNTQGVNNISLGDYTIPTDRQGRLTLNYRGAKKTFKYISAIDILNDKFNKKDIEGKIILIGTSAIGLLDLRAMPFDSVFPGVEIHANAIDNIITEDFLSKPQELNDMDIINIFIVSIVTVLLVTYSAFWLNPLIMIFMSSLTIFISYYYLFEEGLIFNIFLLLISITLSTIVATFLDYIFEIKKEKQIKKKFASKVSKAVMDNLLENPNDTELQAIQRDITVFFSDLRGFTNISESMPDAKTLISFMNEYTDPMSDIIIKNHGTIDKYIGDSIMAYWNAPVKLENHATHAVNTALEQLHMLKKLNKYIKKQIKYKTTLLMCKKNNIEPIDIGIGINTGMATIGEMGSSQRSDYTAIGDSVNIASRIESLCKYYDSRCSISKFTKDQLQGNYIFRYLDLVRVKGKNKAVDIWQVHDYDKDDNVTALYNVSKKQITYELELYHKAISLYKEAKFKDALDLFMDINDWNHKTNNNIYEIYTQRCAKYIIEPPENFDGIFEHITKG